MSADNIFVKSHVARDLLQSAGLLVKQAISKRNLHKAA